MSVTVPVGVPDEPVTVPVTVRETFETMVLDAGTTVTVAVAVPVAAVQPFTTFATFSDPRPVARSNPTVPLYPSRMPNVSPECETVQFGVLGAQAIEIVPVSTSLK